MSAVAIVLGRAGSKGLPGKNLALLAGRPCVVWTIDDALRSRGVGAVAVSSDSPEMLEVGVRMGAVAVERPAALATDSARVDDAARHAAGVLERAGVLAGGDGEPVVILYANVPVRPAGLVDRAIDLLEGSGCDSVQSYAPVGKHHPWWTARLDDAGRVAPWEGEVLNHGVFRRQDLPRACVPDGGVIALTLGALRLRVGAAEGPHGFLGRDRRGILSGEGEVVDIDTRLDQIVAEALLLERTGRVGQAN